MATAVLLVMVFSLVALPAASSTNITSISLTPISNGWYQMVGDEEVAVNLSQPVATYGKKTVVLHNDSLGTDDAGLTLTTRAAEYKITIQSGDEVLYAYDDTGFPRNEQMRSKMYCNATLPSEGTINLTITYVNVNETSTIDIPEVYIGTGSAVVGDQINDSVFGLAIDLLMLILCVLCFAVAIYLAKVGMYDARFTDIGFFLLVCVVWCLTDSSVIQLLFPNINLVSAMSFYAFMLMAIPMIHFVKHCITQVSRRVMNVLATVFYANVILQSVLAALGVAEFIDMLTITHLLLAAGVVTCMVQLWRDYRITDSKDELTALEAFALLGASGLLALSLYWAFEISFYAEIFQCGLLVFCVCLTTSVVTATTSTFRFRNEAARNKRLAREDGLTSLGNRRAFDEYTMEIIQHAGRYPEALLFMFDLNGLKPINDTFGHSAGDEMIRQAAQCIDSAFCSDGRSFRIGGDEFATIIPNPASEAQFYMERLNAIIAGLNETNAHPISMAQGTSCLTGADGKLRKLGDWVAEADFEMYANKGREYGRSRR